MNHTSVWVVVLLTAALSIPGAAQDRQEYLGARFEPGSRGVLVAAVAPGSPAAKAGLRSGDTVQALDGQPIDDAVDLVDALKARHSGAPPRLMVRREGRIVAVTLGPGGSGSRPAPLRPAVRPAAPRSGVAPATASSAPPLGAHGHRPGLARQAGYLRRAHAGFRTVDRSGGIRMQLHRYGQGYAYAPASWTISGSPQGNSISVGSPDRSVGAGWIMIAVRRAMQPYNGDVYGDPNTSMRAILVIQLRALGDSSGVRFTGPDRSFDARGFFKIRSFESAAHRGAIFYHIFPAPLGSGPGDYIESLFVALARKPLWDKLGPLAINVAASIRAQIKLEISAGGGPLPRPGSSDGPDTSSYNKELGMEYVHSPSTGENYWVSYADSYNETGPDGPGYYRQVGSNGYEKLEPGWQWWH